LITFSVLIFGKQ